MPLARSVHRGQERPLDHSSAYGQRGEVMIEFVHQNNAGPSAFRDLYPEGSGRWGLHPTAIWIEDVDAEAERLAGEGFPLAQRAEMIDGFVFAFVDSTAAYGHMLELYAPVPALSDFYAMVGQAADGYQGGDVTDHHNIGRS